jgi:NodT family efflux transporter outer membrane factor (OMF) lipoprotein
MNTRATIGATVAAVLALPGCALGPTFERPAAPQSTSYVAASGAAAQPAGPALVYGGEIAADWFSLFHSAALEELVHRALASNPDLDAARHGLLAAQEELRAVSGAQYPQLDAHASVSRAHANGSLLYQPANAFNATANLYSFGPALAYQLDVFGGVRRAIESQAASTAHEHHEALNVYVSLVNQVIATAFDYASTQTQIDVTRALIADLQSQLELTRQLESSGKITDADVLQAQTELARVRATLPALTQALAHDRNALARLTGTSPDQLQLPRLTLHDFTLPGQLPVSLPSELVRQRPDILAAEDLLHQASAQVGVAEAARFPSFIVSASYAQQTTQLNELFTHPGGIWSGGLDVAAPILNGGQLAARAREARERYAQARQTYRGIVLNALVEVADALEALHNDADSYAEHTVALTSSAASRDLAEAQFRAGTVTELEVLIAQQQYQSAALSQVQADARRFADMAELFRALGGGWWKAPGDPVAPPAAASVPPASRQP